MNVSKTKIDLHWKYLKNLLHHIAARRGNSFVHCMSNSQQKLFLLRIARFSFLLKCWNVLNKFQKMNAKILEFWHGIYMAKSSASSISEGKRKSKAKKQTFTHTLKKINRLRRIDIHEKWHDQTKPSSIFHSLECQRINALFSTFR